MDDKKQTDTGLKVTIPTSFEDVLQVLAMPGKFQIWQMTLTLLAPLLMNSMTMSFVFLGYEPPHRCNKVNESQLLSTYGLLNDSSATVVYESCDIKISSNQNGQMNDVMIAACENGRDFSAANHTTWLSEWDLVCESKGTAELSFTIFNAGLIVGGVVASSIADRFGRKPILVLSAFLCCLCEFAVVFLPNIYFIYAIRFASGVFRQSLCETYYILGVELCEPRHRAFYGTMMCFSWVFYNIIFTIVAFIFQDYNWRYYQAAVAATGILFILYPFFLQESPRWLTANNRFDEALAILKKGCKQNSADFTELKEKFNQFISEHNPNTNSHNNLLSQKEHEDNVELTTHETMVKAEKGSFLTLFRRKKLLVLTLASAFIWLTHNMTYYGLFMTSSTLAGNRFINFGLMSIVELPGLALITYLLKKMKRILVLRIFLSMAAVVLFVSSLLISFGGESFETGIAITILFILGKFAISTSYDMLYIITPEIYPTNLRAIGNASCNSISRIGSMLVPFMRPLFTLVKWGPGVIFTVICLIALLLTRLLPEMKDKDLPHVIDDFEKELCQNKYRKKSEII